MAWAGLTMLAVVTHPGRWHPGPIELGIILLAFGPGWATLVSARGAARVAEGLTRLGQRVTGRLALLGALALVLLLGLTFDAYVACVAAALGCGALWCGDLRTASGGWDARLGPWTVAALLAFGTLAAVEALLAWPPVARRLGTPAELNRWEARYDGLWGQRQIFRLRSPYEDTRRRPGVRRVIALGDSFTWGSNIASSDSTWPALLERALETGPSGRPTEVVNLGQRGYSAGNEAELLRRLGWQFAPDLVIVQWLDNDAFVTRPNFETEGRGPFVVVFPWRHRRGWSRNSGVLQLLERTLTGWFYGVREMNARHYTADSPGWLDLTRAYREMGDSAARTCTPILLVLYPFLFPGRWTLASYPEQGIHQQIAAAARAAGFEVLDLLPTFVGAGRDLRQWWGTAYDSHPGGAAQALAARTIADYIQTHRLLARSADSPPSCPP